MGELEVTNNDLTNLLTSTDIATIFLDRRFCIKRFTPATTRLLHLIASDMGRPVSDISQKFTDDDLLSDAEQVLERLVPIAKEVRTDEGDWYIRRILPYRTEDNRIDGTVFTFTDISDRRRSEQRVQDARLYAEGIVETVRDPLVILGSDLRVRSCNRAFYDIFELSPEEALGQQFCELGNRQWDGPALRTRLEEMLPQGQQPSLSGAVVDYEVNLDLGNLGRRTMLLNARAIECDQAPAELILLAIEDITDRKRAAEQLRQLNETLEERVAERARSHARLASLVASTSDAVIALDVEGKITDWNAGAELLFGYAEHEMVGRDIDLLHPPDRLIEYQQVLDQLRRGETVAGLETVWLNRDGQRRNVSLTVSLIKTPDGQVSGVSGILRDITDRKRLEHKLAELTSDERRRLGQELHDSLGQQMSALGMLALSLQKTLEAKSSPELACITRLVQGLDDAKANIRALARGLLPVEVDAEGLMNALRELTTAAEQIYGMACIFDCQRPVRLDDNTIATHLYNIAKESINNAGQHAHAKQVIVSLREDDQITLRVHDDGIGLPAEPSTVKGSGLRIMRYRAGLIGATLSVTAEKRRRHARDLLGTWERML